MIKVVNLRINLSFIDQLSWKNRIDASGFNQKTFLQTLKSLCLISCHTLANLAVELLFMQIAFNLNDDSRGFGWVDWGGSFESTIVLKYRSFAKSIVLFRFIDINAFLSWFCLIWVVACLISLYYLEPIC